MTITMAVPIILLVLFAVIDVLLFPLSTEIGREGHKNVFIKNLFYVAESVLSFIISAMWAVYSDSSTKLYALGIIVIGLIALVGGVVGINGIFKENQNNLATETLTEIRIVPAGYHNHDRKLEGTVNGKNSWFILRGVDKKWVKKIKESGKSQVTIVYHPSNRRIEEIIL